MIGFFWQSIIFLPRTAKSSQNNGKKERNVKAEKKIQTYIHCYGWIPLTIIKLSATHCQVFSKFWQKNTKIPKRRWIFKHTFIAKVEFLWQSLIKLPRTAKSFHNHGKKNRNVQAEIKIQTFIHCYYWITLTIKNFSTTHCHVFSKPWQEKKMKRQR